MKGRISLDGCVEASYSENYITKFSIGEKVCIKSKALKGILEPILIKSINIKKLGNSYNGYDVYVIYIDNQNRFWPEEDVIDVQQANNYVNNYIKKLKKYINELDACKRKEVLPKIISIFPDILN